MGQQQLLLIVLGVIIVGIAVVVGINIFSSSSMQSNRDAVTADLTNLATLAQQYYKKPVVAGGGGNSFTGWSVPVTVDTTGNGVYTIGSASASSITLVGIGNEKGNNGTENVKVTMVVASDKIESTSIEN
jgi:Tfp pilus assembly protein PilE